MKIHGCHPRPGPDAGPGSIAGIGRWLPKSLDTALWDDVGPADADLIVVPYVFRTSSASPHQVPAAMRAFLELLPLWPRLAARHVIVDATDTATPYPFLEGAALLKTSASLRWPEVIPIPFVVPEPGPVVPITDALHDVCFRGCVKTHPIRAALQTWSRTWKSIRVSFEATDKPFYAASTAQDAAQQRRFQEQIAASRFVLCPRGRGMNSRRFFEVLASGRIPVLVSDAVRLPLASRIDYDGFVVHVPEGMGRWTPDYLEAFTATHDLVEASRRAREVYTTWFAPERFRHFLEAALEEAGRAPLARAGSYLRKSTSTEG